MGISNRSAFASRLLFTVAVSAVGQTPAFAQQAIPSHEASSPQDASRNGSEGEQAIVVTARKRAETMLDVPVAMSALGAKDLARYAASDFSAIANQVPGLIVQSMPGGAGGSIALRGVTSSNQNPAIDQAVALNVDGVQIGSANFLRLGQIDLQQIEVLKGPQALFFGKNSPGGVISIRTADPTAQFEASVSTGYEFNAREMYGQAIISGPLAENLKGRLVVYGSKMGGYVTNSARAMSVSGVPYTYAPEYDRGPHAKELFLRGTLLFDPSDAFDVRLKYSFSRRTGSSPYNTQQRINCPYGAPQVLGYPTTADCVADDRATTGGLNKATLAANPWLGKEIGFTRQHLGSLEMNYHLSPEITLSSVSGFFKIDDRFMGNASYQDGSPLIAGVNFTRRELSQEVRLTTDGKDWPVNLTLGGFYQHVDLEQAVPLIIDGYAMRTQPAPGLGWSPSDNAFDMKGKTWSAFGQARWNILDNVELAGGVRYTHEQKSIAVSTLTGGNYYAPRTTIHVLSPRIKFQNWSPEATLTYRPTRNLTLFGAYRNGYKSGGFNTGGGAYANGQMIDYAPEKAKGFEVGLKTVQGAVSFNLTAYSYKYSDMQVSTFDPATLTQTVLNAASARIKGLEADITYRTPLDGLTLRGSVNYNHARYKNFLVGCYTGQTVADGCSSLPNAVLSAAIAGGFDPLAPGASFPTGGRFLTQNFAGRPLYLAPDWTGNVGFTYDTPVGHGLKLGLTGDANLSSNFFSQLEESPYGKQKGYAMFDASIRLADEDDRWEIALIGKNLSNVYRSRFVSQVSFTGISSRTGTNVGGGLTDYSGQVNRGRELRVQVKYNFR